MSQNILSQIRLFSDLPQTELDELLTALEPKTLQPNEILFREGDSSETFYIVTQGEIEILLGEGRADEMLLNLVKDGEYLGEMGLALAGGSRTATARAKRKTSLLCMTRARFLELTAKHPELYSTMARVLSHRLDAANTLSFRELAEKNKQLQAAYDELKAAQEQLIEKERMERELQVAANIQISILPDALPQTEKIDCGARIAPARQVGGDFYDVFQLSENQLGVVIGDVADKGVPSAIFMARAHALIMAEAEANLPPGEVMRAVNRHITRLQKVTQFVTVLYGVLNLETREFRYARAGHEPPLLLYADGKVERLPHSAGMALGLWEDITLDERAITLPQDATLLLYTDGMTDCRNPNGEPFGLERIKQNLAGLSFRGAQRICDYLLETLKTYQSEAKQDDDVTLLVIHMPGGQAAPRLQQRGSELARHRREKM